MKRKCARETPKGVKNLATNTRKKKRLPIFRNSLVPFLPSCLKETLNKMRSQGPIILERGEEENLKGENSFKKK